ncbi:MAG: AB-hydrolase associated lipase region [Gemmatimonadetes bacterium]|jgi:lysosomal acid lipase/cholesteryl ester hydrolase|nr:AB-hydrolase associated lipase region [Gemmatimonadota bacterium]
MAYEREIPLYTLDGVRDADVSYHPFSTEDKLGLQLHRFTRGRKSDDVVLIIHGLTTSMDMFIMPEHTNLVTYLLDNGFSDVWCLDFRMSNRFNYNLAPHRYTMDDIALYDFPPAIEKIRQVSGDKRIHVICHCLGAVSFVMSVFAGVVDVTSVIANSVTLTPRVPGWSRVKLQGAPFFVESVLSFPYLSPGSGDDPVFTRQKLFAKAVSLFHRECDVSGCHMLSLMWGAGWPALYEHDNLADVTHRRGRDLYGATSMHYYRHVRKMVSAGGAVKYDRSNTRHAALPDDYLANARNIKTPVLFMTGKHNRVFADSNIHCYERLRNMGCDWHELHVFPGYGHQDPFMGKNVHIDIFPRLLQHLRKYGPDSSQTQSPSLRALGHPVPAG